MMNWLRQHGWVEDYQGQPFSQTASFLAFLVMPGCVFGAIFDRIFWNH